MVADVPGSEDLRPQGWGLRGSAALKAKFPVDPSPFSGAVPSDQGRLGLGERGTLCSLWQERCHEARHHYL